MRLEIKTGPVGHVLKVDGVFFTNLPLDRQEEVLHTLLGGLDPSRIEEAVRAVLGMVPASSPDPLDVPGRESDADRKFWDF